MALLLSSFHVGVTAYQIFVSKWMIDNHMKEPVNTEIINDVTIKSVKRFSSRFLTNWTFTLLTLYFILCLFEDIILMFKGGDFLKNPLRKIKNYMFTVLVAPMIMLVTVFFWGMWFIDRELIFPKILDAVLPVWINHSLHTITSIFVLIELLISPHQYVKLKQALIGISSYLAVYFICLLWTYLQTGVWLYPIFKVANWPLKVTLFIMVYALAIGIYLSLQFVSSFRWPEKQRPKPIKKKSKRH